MVARVTSVGAIVTNMDSGINMTLQSHSEFSFGWLSDIKEEEIWAERKFPSYLIPSAQFIHVKAKGEKGKEQGFYVCSY